MLGVGGRGRVPLTHKSVCVGHFAKFWGLSGLWHTWWGLHQSWAEAKAGQVAWVWKSKTKLHRGFGVQSAEHRMHKSAFER